jgi:hypothetical protein
MNEHEPCVGGRIGHGHGRSFSGRHVAGEGDGVHGGRDGKLGLAAEAGAGYDPVAGLDAIHARADCVDGARHLVTEDDGRCGSIGVEAGAGQHVCEVEPGGLDRHAHLPSVRLRVRQLLHLQHLRRPVSRDHHSAHRQMMASQC